MTLIGVEWLQEVAVTFFFGLHFNLGAS